MSDLDGDRFEAALERIDAANADDPNRVEVDGAEHPWALVHSVLATAWVQRLRPESDELALLAARAAHLRRWELPRSEYPEGRAGYLRWRTAAKKRHAEDVAGILTASGYDDDEVARVQAVIRKEGLGADPAVQAHEDALCLVFLSHQLDELVDSLGEDKAVDVLVRTLAKMSPAAIAEAGGIDYSPSGGPVVGLALERHAG